MEESIVEVALLTDDVVVETLPADPQVIASKSKPSSAAWNYFHKVSPDHVECNVCHSKLKFASKDGTSSMLNHIRRHERENQVGTQSAKIEGSQTVRRREKDRRLRTSIAWDYFKSVGIDMAECQICNIRLNAKSTSNLLKHVMRRHKEQHSQIEAEKQQIIEQESALLPEGRQDHFNCGGKLRSVIWNYFKKIKTGVSECQACGFICHYGLRSSGTTTPMYRHLKRRHPLTFDQVMAERHAQREEGFVLEEKINTDALKPLRSVIWLYFLRDVSDSHYAVCKVCGLRIIYRLSTGTLFKHLKTYHRTVWEAAEAQKEEQHRNPITEMEVYLEANEATAQRIIEEEISKNEHTAAVDDLTSPTQTTFTLEALSAQSDPVKRKRKRKEHEIDDSLMRLMAASLLPPSFVELEEFKEYARALNPRYVLPTEECIRKTMVPQLVETLTKVIKLEVDNASYLALSMEKWVYQKSLTCVTLMAHFIKDSWEIANAVLETFECTDKEETLPFAVEIKRITDDWGITSKVFSLILDPSEEIAISASLSIGFEPLVCFGKTLNAVIMNALNSVQGVSDIRRKVREMIDFFDKNVTAYESLVFIQNQHSIPQRKLIREEEHRWNSTFNAMERILEQYEAVNTILCELNQEGICFSDDDVKLTRLVIDILRPFEDAITDLFTDRYTAMSKVIPLSNVLLEVTATADVYLSDDTGALSSLKDALLEQMQTHLKDFESSTTLAITTLLDPRFKHYAFTDTAALESAKEQLLKETVIIANASGSSSTTTAEETADYSDRSAAAAPQTETAVSKPKKSSLWSGFDKRVSNTFAQKAQSSEAEKENYRYFKEAVIPRDDDPLEWWKLNQIQFPNIKVLAQKYLCVPATSQRWSHLFSKEGEAFKISRNRVKPYNLNNMLFLCGNFQYQNQPEFESG